MATGGRGAEMGRTAHSAQSGRAGERAARIAKARRRRLELDTDRAGRDARIDQAVADAYLAQEERVAAQERVAAADVKIGTAILRILAEGIPMPLVAGLIELSVTQVHRLKVAAVKADVGVPPGPQPRGTGPPPPTGAANSVSSDPRPSPRPVDDRELSTTSSSAAPSAVPSATLDQQLESTEEK